MTLYNSEFQQAAHYFGIEQHHEISNAETIAALQQDATQIHKAYVNTLTNFEGTDDEIDALNDYQSQLFTIEDQINSLFI